MFALFLSITTPVEAVTVLPTVDEQVSSVPTIDTPPATPTPKTPTSQRKTQLGRSFSLTPTESKFSITNPGAVLHRYFFGPPKTKRSLSEEAECGDQESMSSWCREGTDPNAFDEYGYTALLNASAVGRLCAIKELIKVGANVNLKGPFGFTPLHAAAQNGHRECVAALLEAGASINAQNNDMDTAMHLALRAQYIEIVYLLLRNGASAKLEGFQKKDCVNIAKDCGLADLSYSLKNYNTSIGFHAQSESVLGRNKPAVLI